MNGFKERRKRDLDLSRVKEPLLFQEIELEEGYEEIEVDDEQEHIKYDNESCSRHESFPGSGYTESVEESEEASQLFINGKQFVPRAVKKKQTFLDTHVRTTTYFEKNVHQIIHMLQKQGQIESITKFVNESMKEYLMNHYHNDN